jgi:hypothetical protein
MFETWYDGNDPKRVSMFTRDSPQDAIYPMGKAFEILG